MKRRLSLLLSCRVFEKIRQKIEFVSRPACGQVCYNVERQISVSAKDFLAPNRTLNRSFTLPSPPTLRARRTYWISDSFLVNLPAIRFAGPKNRGRRLQAKLVSLLVAPFLARHANGRLRSAPPAEPIRNSSGTNSAFVYRGNHERI